MNMVVTLGLAAGWMALVALLAWGVASTWKRMLANRGPLPLFAMMERRGLSRERVYEAAGAGLYAAVRRCAMCRQSRRCGDWLAKPGGSAPDCPNAELLERAARR